MEKPYHIIEGRDSEGLKNFLVKHGQGLLPMVELIEQSQGVVDEMIDVLGRAMIEAVPRLSAEQIAGPPHPGIACRLCRSAKAHPCDLGARYERQRAENLPTP